MSPTPSGRALYRDKSDSSPPLCPVLVMEEDPKSTAETSRSTLEPDMKVVESEIKRLDAAVLDCMSKKISVEIPSAEEGRLKASLEAKTSPGAKLATVEETESHAKSSKKHVRFGQVDIYEHLIALGGGTVPRNGPPLTIQHQSQAFFSLSVDDYEKYRPTSRKGAELLRSKAQRINV